MSKQSGIDGIKNKINFGAVPLLLLLAGCSNPLTAIPGGDATTTVSGRVSAGPVNGAKVTAYTLKADGTLGAQLATSTSDSTGKYSLNLDAQSGPVAIVATGGSYAEEATGATVSLGAAQIRALLPSTTSAQAIAVTPVTEIAAQQALTAINSNTSTAVAAIIKSSNSKVAAAMGLNDITAPPADPSLPASSASNTEAAKYAIVLAGISKMAQSVTTTATGSISSLDMMQALASTFTYNGSFSSTLAGSTAVPVPNPNGVSLDLSSALTTVGGSTDFSTAMHAASVLASTNMGYNSVPAPSYVTSPPVSTGQATLTLPAPPATLPTLSPSVSGPPPVVGQPATAAPVLMYNPLEARTGTVGYPMVVTPSLLTMNGATLSNCVIKTGTTALPTGMTVNAHTCVISGTPSATAATTQYTLIATNSVGNSADALVTFTVNPVGPHIYIADVNFGNLVCAVNTTTGQIGACGSHTEGTFLSHDMSAVTINGVTNLFIASGGGITPCTVNVATGGLNCVNNAISSLQNVKRATMFVSPGGTLFGYALDYAGVHLCATTAGVPTTCQTSNAGLALPFRVAGPNYTAGDWYPESIAFFTTTGGSTYAYVLEDHLTGSLFICSVDNTTGVLSNCAASPASGIPQLGGLSQIIVKTIGSTTYAYGALGGFGKILKCTINGTDGTLSGCVITNGGISTTTFAWAPISMSISNLGGSNYFAYVADQLASKIYVCSVSATDGTLSSCTINATPGMQQPDGLTVF